VCLAELGRLKDQQADIRKHVPRHETPAAVMESVRAAVRREAARETPKAVGPHYGWWAVAASVLLALSLGWNLALLRSRPSAGDQMADALVSNHVRSLMGNHLLDVETSDQHTVKPWFNGKVDFSPEVKDLAGEGFPLMGGRVEYISGRTAAALVYRRRQHLINLFIWPAGPNVTRREWFRQGFHLIQWQQGGMSYWAVSDLTADELRQFCDFYRKP